MVLKNEDEKTANIYFVPNHFIWLLFVFKCVKREEVKGENEQKPGKINVNANALFTWGKRWNERYFGASQKR